MSEMQTVQVGLKDRAYDILVGRGLINRLGQELAARLSGGAGRLAVVVSSPEIAGLYGAAVSESLAAAGFQVETASVPTGERSKSLASVEELYTKLHSLSADRRTVVIALGGGVIGDLTGFAAATYTRGLNFAQIPTTLLAQVDSSVGGKTGVNFGNAKNLIGAFYQPALVVIDPDVLRTLPERETRSGLAEVIKYGIIADKDFAALLGREMPDLLSLASTQLEYVIAHSCAIKARVVEEDEREDGLRAILNFGHTVGHALESLTHYGTYTHGEAIALGMVSACLIGEGAAVTRPEDTAAVIGLLRAAGFQINLDPSHSTAEIIRLLAWDKKSVGGSARFVLLEEMGRATPGHQVSEVIIGNALTRQQRLADD